MMNFILMFSTAARVATRLQRHHLGAPDGIIGLARDRISHTGCAALI